MKIFGKCKIANKFINGKVDSSQFQFEDKGKFAIGTLTWSDKIKDKDGKESWSNCYKSFIVFEKHKHLFANNLGKSFEIDGYLVANNYVDKLGKKVSSEQVKINNVNVYEVINQHSVDKGNGFVSDDSMDDEIPF